MDGTGVPLSRSYPQIQDICTNCSCPPVLEIFQNEKEIHLPTIPRGCLSLLRSIKVKSLCIYPACPLSLRSLQPDMARPGLPLPHSQQPSPQRLNVHLLRAKGTRTDLCFNKTKYSGHRCDELLATRYRRIKPKLIRSGQRSSLKSQLEGDTAPVTGQLRKGLFLPGAQRTHGARSARPLTRSQEHLRKLCLDAHGSFVEDRPVRDKDLSQSNRIRAAGGDTHEAVVTGLGNVSDVAIREGDRTRMILGVLLNNRISAFHPLPTAPPPHLFLKCIIHYTRARYDSLLRFE